MKGDPGWEHFVREKARAGFVTVGEHKLWVIETGSGDPLLLIHGFADSSYTWHRNLEALAEAGFRVIAYDLPGCGESTLPTGASFGVDDQAELALGLLDVLGIERTDLIGASMGGGTSLYLAVHHPERLRRAVLVAPVCYHAPFRPFVHLAHWRPVGAMVQRFVGPWVVRIALLTQYGDPARIPSPAIAQYQRPFERPEYLQACVGMVREYWNSAFRETSRHYGEIPVPLRLIWGERDMLVRPRQYAYRLAADTGADLTLVAGAGHVVHQDRPQWFNDRAIEFLRS